MTKSIGTDTRDYSTVTLWEADLGGDAGGSGNDAVGEMYDDSAFDEKVTFNDTTPDSMTLKAATGEGHDGTTGTGVRLVYTGGATVNLWAASIATKPLTVQDIELNANGKDAWNILVASANTTVEITMQRLLAHGSSPTGTGGGLVLGSAQSGNVQNCIAYNLNASNAAATTRGIAGNGSTGTRPQKLFNNTVWDITSSAGTGRGINLTDQANQQALNNFAGGCDDGDFEVTSYSNATVSHNATTDTSSSGTGSLDSVVAADQFVSVVGGSEDLHLKTGADLIDAGTDLGTTPTGVNLDIDGRDRDAEADTWDIGADEFVAGSAESAAPLLPLLMVG